MHDIQLVDLRFDEALKINPNAETVDESLGWLVTFLREQFKDQSKNYVSRLSTLEETIDLRQNRIKDLENDEIMEDQVQWLHDEQIKDIHEHTETVKMIESLCQQQQQVFAHLTRVQQNWEKLSKNYQSQNWDFIQGQNELESLRLQIKSKEQDYAHVVLLVEKKNRQIAELEKELRINKQLFSLNK